MILLVIRLDKLKLFGYTLHGGKNNEFNRFNWQFPKFQFDFLDFIKIFHFPILALLLVLRRLGLYSVRIRLDMQIQPWTLR